MENDCRDTIGNFIAKLYKQDLYWACYIACIRTIVSGIVDDVPSEEQLIANFKLKAENQYSKDIKEKKLLENYDTVYGCDLKSDSITIELVAELMRNGYYIMVESAYNNFAHWDVILKYYNLREHKLIIYDPYIDEVKTLEADEFNRLWSNEFVAIKKKS